MRDRYEAVEPRKRLSIIGLRAIDVSCRDRRNARHDGRLLGRYRAMSASLLELDELVSTLMSSRSVALTPDTHGLIGSDQFARMKRRC